MNRYAPSPISSPLGEQVNRFLSAPSPIAYAPRQPQPQTMSAPVGNYGGTSNYVGNQTASYPTAPVAPRRSMGTPSYQQPMASPNQITYQNPVVARETANQRLDQANYMSQLPAINHAYTPPNKIQLTHQQAKTMWDSAHANGFGVEGYNPVEAFARTISKYGIDGSLARTLAEGFQRNANTPELAYNYMSPSERSVYSQGPLDPNNMSVSPVAPGGVMPGYDPIKAPIAPRPTTSTTQPSYEDAANRENAQMNAMRSTTIAGLERRGNQMLQDLEPAAAPVDPRVAAAEAVAAGRVAGETVKAGATTQAAETKAGATTQASADRAGATTQAAGIRADATTQAAQTRAYSAEQVAQIRAGIQKASGGKADAIPNGAQMYTFGTMMGLKDDKGKPRLPNPDEFTKAWAAMRSTLNPNPAPAGNPAGAAAPQQPQIHVNPQTGQRIQFNPQTNAWEPIK